MIPLNIPVIHPGCFLIVTMNQKSILIIGATTRSASAMCRRAGLDCYCFDQYCDWDLQKIAVRSETIDLNQDGPDAVTSELFRNFVSQNLPWIFTGPLENNPTWIESAPSLAENIWGNSTDSIRRSRNPQKLFGFLSGNFAGFAYPHSKWEPDPPPYCRDWLWKPLRSTGGWETVWATNLPKSKILRCLEQDSPAGYWQKWIHGPTFGLTVASGDHNAVLLGVCQSFHGAPGRPFAYAGSRGPVHSRLIRKWRARLERLVKALAQEFCLKGLWNLDLVYSVDQKCWYVLEINPRISASMEVLEISVGKSLFQIHQAIFQNNPNWIDLACEFSNRSFIRNTPELTKRIIYAYRNLRPSLHKKLYDDQLTQELWPKQNFFADIPHPNITISRGMPVCSQFTFTLPD